MRGWRRFFLGTPLGYTPERNDGDRDVQRPQDPLRALRAAIKEEVSEVVGVAAVEVDVDTKVVTIDGESLDGTALRAAIEEAGYEAA